jgi:predicted nucleic acid-binding protein
LIARDVRMKATDANTAAKVESRFESLLAASFNLLMPTIEDINLCKRYLQHYESALRAGDALHLAIAKNNNAQAIYSLDDKMLKAGKLLGLPVSRGIRGR